MSETISLILWHFIPLLFFFAGSFYFSLYIFKKDKINPQEIFFSTGFKFYFDGIRKNFIYWDHLIPHFRQQLNRIKTVYSLLDDNSRETLTQYLGAFESAKPTINSYKAIEITFIINNRKITGIFKSQNFDNKKKILSGFFTNFVNVKTKK